MDALYRGTYYKYDKRPRVISPNGDEEYPTDPELWALFQETEGAKEEKSNKLGGQQLHQTPQKVIDKLFAARGELDVINDVIAGLEHQQAMAVTHSPYQPDQRDVVQQRHIASARRLHALGQGIDRLQFCVGSLRESKAMDDRFLHELQLLRKKWNLQRRDLSQGGAFYVDMSVKLLLPLKVAIEKGKSVKPRATNPRLQRQWEQRASYDIYPDPKDGVVCLNTNNDSHSLCKGIDKVDGELHNRYLALVWNTLLKLVAMERKAGQPSGNGTLIIDESEESVLATQWLLNTAGKAINSSSGDSMDVGGIVVPSLSLRADTLEVIDSEEIISRFRVLTLDKMSKLMEAAEIPSLIADMRSLPDGIHDDLVNWVHQAINEAKITRSLARQESKLRSAGHQVSIHRLHDRDMKSQQKWEVIVGEEPLGSIVLTQSSYPVKLRWEGGQPLPGLPTCFGIGKLDGLLTLAVETAGVRNDL